MTLDPATAVWGSGFLLFNHLGQEFANCGWRLAPVLWVQLRWSSAMMNLCVAVFCCDARGM